MIDRLTKFGGLIPLLTILIYIMGYLVLVSYLQSYGINESIGLELRTIKLGVLLAIAIGPVILIALWDFDISDDNSDAQNTTSLINGLHDALGYSIIYSLSVSLFLFNRNFDIATCLLIGFLTISFVLNKIKRTSSFVVLLKMILLILPFFSLMLLSILIGGTSKTYFYTLQLSIFTTCVMLRIFSKNDRIYKISQIGTIVTAGLFSCNFFGAFIVGDISEQYGGEKKSSVRYHVSKDDIERVKATSLKSYLSKDSTLTVIEIYQSADLRYFKTSSKNIVALPKSYVEIQEIEILQGYPKIHY